MNIAMKLGAAVLATAMAAIVLFPAAASGDKITLKSGQVLEGKVIESGDRVTLVTPFAGIIYSRDEIASIEYGPTPLEAYTRQASELRANDAEGHYKLGAFAESKGLYSQAHDEYSKAIAAHPNHAQAREKLGYVRENGAWVSREEVMARRGYVLYKGRYVTRDEAERLQAKDAEYARSREARLTVQGLADLIRRSRGQQRVDAQEKLAGMADPAALDALISATLDADASVRSAALAALRNYREDAAALAILDVAVGDSNDDIRYQARTILGSRQSEVVFAQAVALLDAPQDLIRFHASEVLGSLGDLRAVPYLIDNLSWDRPRGASSPQPAPSLGQDVGQLPSYGSTYVAGYRAKVAPGVVALEPIIGGFDMYGNPIIVNPEPQDTWQDFAQDTTELVLNYEAHSALQALSGQDLRFDKDAWRAWYLANANRLRGIPGPVGPGNQ